ncbi:hypothetical protein KEM09_03090 [Carboxylicivirga mesophila]|uniref:Uncharacterized protein n=2 Tax=Carboxylicivirga TaxID=1628153 RepID=A0A941F245_9BACT|nr:MULTISPECIES: hypothetical protein [Carboxylicivirga]MBR8534355.1 hypothetical protein [Carboxylicivirga sediminis]MBS2210366.1 hypothetical protein [Carboxylicivirga mesophila]
MTTLLVILFALLGFGLWFWKKGLALLAEKNASKELEKILFPKGASEKEATLVSLQKITKDKYNNDLLLDYFLKIKGLQVINMYDPVNFWTRRFLMSPTKVKLNYFEQVKFYESFLNYPQSSARIISTASKEYITSESNGGFYKKQQLA